jgi:membrane-bound ClpP family serine protease
MEPSLFAILLLILGLALLVAEIFLPSGGMISVAAVICFAGSVGCAWNAWWVSSPASWWAYIASAILLVPAVIGGALYALPRTSIGKRILLAAPDLEEVTPFVQEQDELSKLIGRNAKTLTMLGPGGMLLIDGERMHCESLGMLVDPDTQVEIIAIKGNRLVVRPYEANVAASDAFLSEEESGGKQGEAASDLS